MTSFYLIRHGSNDYFRHMLVGRTTGIHLNETGRFESAALAEYLAGEDICKIFTSPLERCRETAEPIAARLRQEIELSDALLEVNFGDWTGKPFSELDSDPLWKQWNTFRSGGRAPNGETASAVQSRMLAFISTLRTRFEGKRVGLVSHADPLKSVILYFLGAPLEFIRRIELSPASVSILEIDGWEPRLHCINARPGPLRP